MFLGCLLICIALQSYAYEPVFKTGVYIIADSVIIDAGSYSVPNVYDWNNDGRKDLLVGNTYGWVYVYINEGTDENPVLGAASRQIKYTTNKRAAPYMIDWNLDGLPDILSGCQDGTIYYFEQEFVLKFESILHVDGIGIKLKWRSRPNDIYIVYFSDDMQSWTPFPEAILSKGLETE